MKYVLILIGGTGAKVGEAFIRLAMAGVPTRIDKNKILTSSGDEVQIWRVDPDRSSGAAIALQKAVDDYRELQINLGGMEGHFAWSEWGMKIDTRIRHLDPLQISQVDRGGANSKTLRGILDSHNLSGLRSSKPFLDTFYEPKELDVQIDRGFYQKPFIGASVMAVFTHLLKDQNSPGGKELNLNEFEGQEVRFFLCGSLHGGTGACGVPVMAQFLGEIRNEHPTWGWKIGAALMAPYTIPPQPPFRRLKPGEDATPQIVEEHFRAHGTHAAFSGLEEGEKRELVRQILLGFYADPEEMQERAQQGLAYYQDHASKHLNDLYLVGKPAPDLLPFWSNGGKSQRNPLHATEVVAALAAFNFFASPNEGTHAVTSYKVGTSTEHLNATMSLADFPRSTMQDGASIDLERVFLSSAALYFFAKRVIPWEHEPVKWQGIGPLRQMYVKNSDRYEAEKRRFHNALDLIAAAMTALCDPAKTLGWNNQDMAQLQNYFSSTQSTIDEVKEKTRKTFWSDKARGTLMLGRSAVQVSDAEFGKWCPPENEFTPGRYLRWVWSQVYTKKSS
ncbi:MAG: hypothetical protein HY774_08685 [Acidobacteria bacterium]|nr:hypothetical protein [Acidobacteriota bacterium]